MRCLNRGTLLAALASLVLLVASSAISSAVDWPQWRGEKRDDISTESGLAKSWPEGGPPKLWMIENCGLGYSGPAIVGDTLYILGARDGKECLLTFDAATGKESWHAELGPMLENDWGNGPRSTPTVDGDQIFVMSAPGTVAAIDKNSGEVQWTKAMADLGGKIPVWGYCESPIVYKETVLCTPGGEKGAIVALNRKTGEVVWQAAELTNGAGYASIVLNERAGQPEAVQLLPEKLVGFDPESGKVRWSEPWGGRVAVIPTPIVHNNLAYATSGYGAGCMLVEIGEGDAVQKLYDNKVMKNHHGGVILLGEDVYGYSDDRGWTCQEFQTGDSKWTEKKALEKGSIAYADGMFYCLGEDTGDVVLIEASPEAWKEVSRFKLDPQTDQRKEKGKIWTHPVIAGGRLYLRDQNLLFCFNVRDPSATAQAGGN